MSADKRLQAAEAFWRDTESPEIAMQHMEALVALARRLNFRPKSLQQLPVERKARHLAQMSDVSDAVATRALIAYHFLFQRPLMAAFLDGLGIAHEDGLIGEENVVAPSSEKLSAGVKAVRGGHDATDVTLYLRTLVALDGETWGNLETLIAEVS